MMSAVDAPCQRLTLLRELANLLSSDSLVRADEPLARRTTLRVGGPADIYVEPAGEEDLAVVLRFSSERSLRLFVLGRGSNLLVKDAGFRGLVVSLSHPSFSRIEFRDRHVFCGAGARLKNLAVEAKRNGVSGLEFLEGIPGTVGGALRMNAGAMGSEMFGIVESVRLVDFQGEFSDVPTSEIDVEYRSCRTLNGAIAVSAVLAGNVETRDSVAKRMLEFSRKRWESQPAAPSAGCIFKNPATIPAGKLVDELGLKGTRVGGAMVSMEHGNFIVNDGSATAADVLQLIEKIKDEALRKRGIELRTEVEIVGE
jgi:UDP-N-acetylenolpyruvoylglucosamine reductase